MSEKIPTEVLARRAPKFSAFMLVGAAVAIILTLIATSLFPVDPTVGFAALFAYFCIFSLPVGIALGALLALVIDRQSRRRAKTLAARHEAAKAAGTDDENRGAEQAN